VQTVGFVPMHFPDEQLSLAVHLSLSSHSVPSPLLGFEHTPVLLLQTPTSWHWSLALHTTGLAPLHAPAWQVSVWVHGSPSSHAPARSGFEQSPLVASHEPGP
jgi:hypothetical protein